MAEGTSSEVWTIGRLLQWTTGWLTRHEVDQPRLSAELLIAHAFGCRKIELYTRFDVAAGPEQLATIRELVRQAAEHVPIPYLIGRKEFFSLEFEVTPAVLIPRPETETLVQKTIDLCRADPETPMNVADLGTGSGCIAVSVARYVPSAVVTASDISPEAIAVARRNAERHAVTGRVRFYVADWLNLPPDAIPPGGFDVIVSNPPYIPASDVDRLDRNVRDYEPRTALTALGSDGLVFYRRLAAESEGRLRPGGSILVEIGHDQHEAVLAIFASATRFTHAGTYRDPTDPHNRVVHVRSK
jgi:release factor glutamine methyltransferase